MFSCQSTQPSKRVTNSSASVLDEANRLYAQQSYEPALVKYSSYVYSPFPNKTETADARYHMGLCQYFLGRYHESAVTMTKLLEEHPQFTMTDEAVEILNQSRIRIEEKKAETNQQQTEQQNSITELQGQINESPKNAQLYYQLANQYWNTGDYQTAALHYEQAILLNPDYERDSLVRNRVYYTDENVLVPRDPLKELQQQDDVIRLSNVRHDIRSRENWLGQRQSIRVSGEAENVSLRTVHSVNVELTLVDFFERIQESQTLQLGSIRPGETRTFSTLLNQYSGSPNDNLKVRAKVFYQ
jgi:tetratricopeptide (TPR) repeat protein